MKIYDNMENINKEMRIEKRMEKRIEGRNKGVEGVLNRSNFFFSISKEIGLVNITGKINEENGKKKVKGQKNIKNIVLNSDYISAKLCTIDFAKVEDKDIIRKILF